MGLISFWLFAFDNWVKCLCGPRYPLMKSLKIKTHALLYNRSNNLTVKLLFNTFTLFMTLLLNFQASLRHSGLVTTPSVDGRMVRRAHLLYLVCVWKWFKTTFKTTLWCTVLKGVFLLIKFISFHFFLHNRWMLYIVVIRHGHFTLFNSKYV